MFPTNDRWPYLAGLFDGEGSFSIQVNVRKGRSRLSVHFNPRMTMTLKYGAEVLTELEEAFGGATYLYADGKSRWSFGRVDGLVIATKTLRPYLRIKAAIADFFLEALSLFPYTRSSHRTGQRSWTRENAIRVAEIAYRLAEGKCVRHKKPLRTILARINQVYDLDERGLQAQPRVFNAQYSCGGVTLTLSEWAEKLDVAPRLLRLRLHRGWPVDKVLSTPKLRQGVR